MYNRYSDEFKLAVVKEYFEGDLGVRLLAQKYNLPSKNYITEWIKQMKAKGLIEQGLTSSRVSGAAQSKVKTSSKKTPYEKELERKLQEVEAKLAFYQKCDELLNGSKKK